MSKTIRGVADHPNRNLMEMLWREGKRAAEIAGILESEGLPPISQRTLARYGQRNWSEKLTLVTDTTDLNLLADVIGQINESDLGKVSKISFSTKKYPGWEKVDGQNVQVDKESTSQTIEVIPTTTDLAPTEVGPFSIKIPKFVREEKPKGFNLGIHFPDSQMGYYRDVDGGIHTIHDEAALDVAYQISGYLEQLYGIDLIVNAGDDLDVAALSTHRNTVGYHGMLQRDLNRHATDLAIKRELAPNAKIVQLQGNHEARLEKALADKMGELLGVHRFDDDTPVLSISHLCRYDEFDVESVGPYPQGEYWANDYLKFHHGTAASGVPGGAASKTLGASNGVSVIYGHDHKQALVHTRIREKDGLRTVFAGSAGCLCRLDGLVPSSAGGIAASGKLVSNEKWQQGIFIVWYEPDGKQRARVEPILIEDGAAIFRGRVFISTVDSDGNYNG